MAIGYFEYEIKALNRNEVKSTDLKFFVDRKFSESEKKFRYVLYLAINRTIDDNIIFPTITNNINHKYIHLLHLSRETESDDQSLIEDLAKRFLNGEISNKEDKVLNDKEERKLFFQKYNISNVDDITGAAINTTYKFAIIELDSLSENFITGIGLIGFSDSKDGAINADDAFIYKCSFVRRCFIEYTVKQNNNKVTFEFPKRKQISKLSKKLDLSLKVFYDSKEIYSFNKLNSLSKTINPRRGSCVVKLDKNMVGNNFFFALGFENPELEKFIILRNISELKEDDKPHNLANLQARCPYCLNNLTISKLKDGDQLCDGNRLYLEPLENNSGNKVYFRIGHANNVYNIYCKDKYYSNRVAAMYVKIPKSYYDMERIDTLSIGLLGRPASGKTVFLSSTFQLQNGREAKMEYLNHFFEKFSLHFSLEPVEGLIQKNNVFENTTISNQKLLQHISQPDFEANGEDNLPFRDFMIKPGTSPFRTNYDKKFFPFILTSKSTNILISDVAGEKSEKSTDFDFNERLSKNDAYIVLIAPNDTTFDKTFKRIMDFGDKNKPLAIVVSKFDILQNEFSSMSETNNDMTYDFIGNNFDNTLLEKHIIRSSNEIRSYLIDHKESFRGFDINEIEDKFKNVRYFAIASLGLNCSIEKTDTNLNFSIDSYTLPFRVELPILWLMGMGKLI